MSKNVTVKKVADIYSECLLVAGSLCLEPNQAALERYLATKGCDVGLLGVVIAEAETRKNGRQPASVKLLKEIGRIRSGLMTTAADRIPPASRNGGKKSAKALQHTLASLKGEEIAPLAGAVRSSRVGKLFQHRDVDASALRAALGNYSKGQNLARNRLVTHLHQLARKAGIRLSPSSIEERMRTATRAKSVPELLVRLVRELDGDFLSGLVPIESMTGKEEPSTWLEQAQDKLRIKSKNAMHTAVAEATSLRYDSVHKALTAPHRGRRIQKEIKDVLLNWLSKTGKGEELPINPRYRVVPCELMRSLKHQLISHYPSKGALVRAASEILGISSSCARRLLNGNGSARPVPMDAYAGLKKLLEAPPSDPARHRRGHSYLSDDGTRKVAERLSRCAKQALRRWQAMNDPRLHSEFKDLRLQLIVTLKEGTPRLLLNEAEAECSTSCA